MPYAADYTATYKSLIKTYWESQIDLTAFSNKVAMKVQLNVFLDNITTAETTYKTNQNNLSLYNLRCKWQTSFGFLSLYVLYQHCMQFPVSSNLPAVQGMMIPIVSGGSLITDDDMRGFSVGWRYSWPGNGTTSTPWFLLADIGGGTGAVQEIDNGIGVGEATAMKNAFTNNYPTYTARYSNTTAYLIGTNSSGNTYSSVSDNSPVCLDDDRFDRYTSGSVSTDPRFGIIDRMREFLNFSNWTTQNKGRFRDGRTILNYLTAGGPLTMINKPQEWMLAHGGQELMDFMGWTDISGNIL